MLLISSFSEVNIKHNSLVIVDIDETILKYTDTKKDIVNEKWWKSIFNSYYDIHRRYDIADDLAYDQWKELVYKSLPEHTDIDGFNEMIKKVSDTNSEIVFVTARHEDMRKITIDHLKHVGVNKYEIHFTSNCNKAPIIHEIHSRKNKDNIIFIDDLISNHNDIQTNFKCEVDCYLFQMNP